MLTPERAKEAAAAYFAKLLEGDQAAFAKLFERQDGKVTQPLDASLLLPSLVMLDRSKHDAALPPSVAALDKADEEEKRGRNGSEGGPGSNGHAEGQREDGETGEG
jgi:hypothetical protein